MRQCDGCTACCQGWLHGTAHGQMFQPGRPCHFKSATGCTIYESRPDNPCKSFTCMWLQDISIPEWMKPNLCDVLITKGSWSGGECIQVFEMGKKIDSIVLNWLFGYHYASGMPLRIQVAGGWNNYGPKEFLQESPGMCYTLKIIE